jgi:hypothetical protein
MRLRKESMRQVADAGMVARAESNIRDAMADPFKRPAEKPQYFRGALIKPKQETKTDGK